MIESRRPARIMTCPTCPTGSNSSNPLFSWFCLPPLLLVAAWRRPLDSLFIFASLHCYFRFPFFLIFEVIGKYSVKIWLCIICDRAKFAAIEAFRLLLDVLELQAPPTRSNFVTLLSVSSPLTCWLCLWRAFMWNPRQIPRTHYDDEPAGWVGVVLTSFIPPTVGTFEWHSTQSCSSWLADLIQKKTAPSKR